MVASDQHGTVKNKLDTTQGCALRRIYGAMNTTPIRALEIIGGMTPLDIKIKKRVIRTA